MNIIKIVKKTLRISLKDSRDVMAKVVRKMLRNSVSVYGGNSSSGKYGNNSSEGVYKSSKGCTE